MALTSNKGLDLDQDAIRRRELEVQKESDQEIMQRLDERFAILNEMTKAVKSGHVKSMIVSGPPGVGKSFGVEEVLTKYSLFDVIANGQPKFQIVKGRMSGIGLYCKLYEFNLPGSVVVFDDCDDILTDEQSLNTLKGALDTNEQRYIAWNTDSRILRDRGIPDRFEFQGSAIFITNIKFSSVKSKRLREHLRALESRSHYIDLQMDTTREKLIRIKQVVGQGMLDKYEFEQTTIDEILHFIETNVGDLRELSLRTVIKVCDLRKTFPRNWKIVAANTVMKRTPASVT